MKGRKLKSMYSQGKLKLSFSLSLLSLILIWFLSACVKSSLPNSFEERAINLVYFLFRDYRIIRFLLLHLWIC